jgi:hypothetical protein
MMSGSEVARFSQVTGPSSCPEGIAWGQTINESPGGLIIVNNRKSAPVTAMPASGRLLPYARLTVSKG